MTSGKDVRHLSPHETGDLLVRMMKRALGDIKLEANRDAFFERTGLHQEIFMSHMEAAAKATSPDSLHHGFGAMVHLGYLLAHELDDLDA